MLFENLGRAVTSAPTTEAKSRLSRAAAEMLAAHEGLVDELAARHDDPVAEMDPFRIPLDEFQRRTQGADWYEILVTCYLTAGFLTDFFVGLAAGLPPACRSGSDRCCSRDKGEAVLVAELRAAIDASPRLASRLAMWGRRLVGDTMLVARSALEQGGGAPEETDRAGVHRAHRGAHAPHGHARPDRLARRLAEARRPPESWCSSGRPTAWRTRGRISSRARAPRPPATSDTTQIQPPSNVQPSQIRPAQTIGGRPRRRSRAAEQHAVGVTPGEQVAQAMVPMPAPMTMTKSELHGRQATNPTRRDSSVPTSR